MHEWTQAGLWSEALCSLLTVAPSVCVSPPSSTPAAASQRWRQPLVVFRELAAASPLPQPPPTHAHPAHAAVRPPQEPGEVCGHALTSLRAVTNKRTHLHQSKNSTNPAVFTHPKMPFHTQSGAGGVSAHTISTSCERRAGRVPHPHSTC